MSNLVVDTHAIVWYFLKSGNLSDNALVAIEQADSVYVASISVVEIIYLTEKGKLPEIALQRFIQALADVNTQWFVMALSLEIAQAIAQISRDIVPDMPDRIITATAFYLNLPLVTCDSKIQAANLVNQKKSGPRYFIHIAWPVSRSKKGNLTGKFCLRLNDRINRTNNDRPLWRQNLKSDIPWFNQGIRKLTEVSLGSIYAYGN